MDDDKIRCLWPLGVLGESISARDSQNLKGGEQEMRHQGELGAKPGVMGVAAVFVGDTQRGSRGERISKKCRWAFSMPPSRLPSCPRRCFKRLIQNWQ